MIRIKIDDLPEDFKITQEEMKRVWGGFYFAPSPYSFRTYNPGRFSTGPAEAIPINIP